MTNRVLLWVLGLAPVAFSSACASMNPEKNARLADIHYRLGVHELHQNRAHLAMKEVLTALKHDPENADAHYTLGFLFQGRREYDKAMHHLKRATEIRPDFADAYNNLGTVYLEQGRYQEAIPLFQKALSVVTYPTPYLPHGNLGWAHHKLGNHRAAAKSLKTALFHNPKFCLGHNNLGLVYATLNEHALAQRHYEKALSLCPKYVEAHYRLGVSLLKSQRRDSALASFKSCEQLSPDSRWGQECGRYSKLLR
jgi:type IV pilus assembly protein PilF